MTDVRNEMRKKIFHRDRERDIKLQIKSAKVTFLRWRIVNHSKVG